MWEVIHASWAWWSRDRNSSKPGNIPAYFAHLRSLASAFWQRHGRFSGVGQQIPSYRYCIFLSTYETSSIMKSVILPLFFIPPEAQRLYVNFAKFPDGYWCHLFPWRMGSQFVCHKPENCWLCHSGKHPNKNMAALVISVAIFLHALYLKCQQIVQLC